MKQAEALYIWFEQKATLKQDQFSVRKQVLHEEKIHGGNPALLQVQGASGGLQTALYMQQQDKVEEDNDCLGD